MSKKDYTQGLTGEAAEKMALVSEAIRQMLREHRQAAEGIRGVVQDVILDPDVSYARKAREIDAIRKILDVRVIAVGKEVIPLSYEAGASHAGSALAALGVRLKEFKPGSETHAALVEGALEEFTVDLFEAHKSIARGAKLAIRKVKSIEAGHDALKKAVGEGIAKGLTRREVTKAIKAEFAKADKVTVLTTRGPRLYDLDHYAELVARTMTRDAVTLGSIHYSLEHGFTLFRVSVHEGACPICQEFQGKVYSMMPGSPFPELTRRPPYHPHCTHTVTAVDADFLKDKGDYDALLSLSKDKGAVVHDARDYDRVLGGGKPAREPKDWGELGKTRAKRRK